MNAFKKILPALFAVALALCLSLAAPAAHAASLPPARVIVTGCTVEGGGLSAGATSTITITLKNTSYTTSVYGVLVTGRWAEDTAPVEFELTNQAYAERISPNEETEVTLSVRTKSVNLSTITSIPCSITISYVTSRGTGDDAVQTENGNSVLVQVPVQAATQAEDDASASQSTSTVLPPIEAGPSDDRLFIYLAGFGLCTVAVIVVLILQRKR